MTGSTVSILMALAVTLVSALAGCAAYRAAKALGPAEDTRATDLANAMAVRIGILHALIVALAFAEVKQNEMDLRRLVAEEAVTTANVFYDFERFEAHTTTEAQALAARYAKDVIRHDWPKLRQEGLLSEEAWDSWRDLLGRALDLDPSSRRQEQIQARLVQNLYSLEEKRQQRQIDAHASPHTVFWVTSIVGLFVICAFAAPYPRRRSTYAFVASLAGFTGAVLYLAYDLSTPFSGLSSIPPAGFEAFIAQPSPAELLAR